MTRRLSLVLIVTLTMLAAMPVSVSADEHDQPIYLSLGASFAAGSLADANGLPIPFSSESYTDQIFAVISQNDDDLRHVKLGCPGETVATFTSGGMCDGGLFDVYDSPQLQEAIDVLESGNVVLVTISLGSNDVAEAAPDLLACGDDIPCVVAILDNIATDVAGAVAAVQAVKPNVPIVYTNSINQALAAWLGFYSFVPAGTLPPDPSLAVRADAGIQIANGLLSLKLGALGVPVVDTFGAFDSSNFADADGNGIPDNVDVICDLTFMCPAHGVVSNPHPTPQGYGVIADLFLATDTDGDGVVLRDDLCLGTHLASDGAPDGQKTNRLWSNEAGMFVFGDADSTSSGITSEDTGGCSASQVIEAAGLGAGHTKFGISQSAIEAYLASIP
jgi:hypothetical protein